MILEVIAINAADVKAAARLGADRIELVTGIAEGGLTPSVGLIEAAVAAANIPVNVMVRPHSQSFCYSDEDLGVMLRDIEAIRRAGAAGIVLGALTSAGGIHFPALEKLLAAAEGLDVTFHRAFDEVRDQLGALQALTAYSPISRILTSGGRAPAPRAIARLRELNESARHTNLRILAGHGLTPDTLDEVLRETGVPEVHFGSAIREDNTFASPISAVKMQVVRKIIDSHTSA
ncbi:copper homeostasis protein CutC [Cohnella cholangitidis]|uniref:PF03932 family protein CutC n=1 Tax=Cohnella cholangitidis TaxID=2598458 RepID=A0A7G5BY54_9BACL|nr:copper homeostasis protein CutC [Cohnella cholangitidis]QMV41888.1 copper homeostasis protein CutC [Cohnella cholangitidis]